MGIEPSGSDFLDYLMPRLLVIAMAIIMLAVALTLILGGTLGWGFILMAMFLLMVGMNLIVVSPSSCNEYDMPLLAGIGFQLLGASFVAFLFGLWFLANPPAGIP